MKALNYLKTNYVSILKEIFWMMVIMLFSNAIVNAATTDFVFGENPIKFFSLIILLSIPAGIGMHLFYKRNIKNYE
jgi:hypothetical protein